MKYITESELKANLSALANLLNSYRLASEVQTVTREQLYATNAIINHVVEALRDLASRI